MLDDLEQLSSEGAVRRYESVDAIRNRTSTLVKTREVVSIGRVSVSGRIV